MRQAQGAPEAEDLASEFPSGNSDLAASSPAAGHLDLRGTRWCPSSVGLSASLLTPPARVAVRRATAFLNSRRVGTLRSCRHATIWPHGGAKPGGPSFRMGT